MRFMSRFLRFTGRFSRVGDRIAPAPSGPDLCCISLHELRRRLPTFVVELLEISRFISSLSFSSRLFSRASLIVLMLSRAVDPDRLIWTLERMDRSDGVLRLKLTITLEVGCRHRLVY